MKMPPFKGLQIALRAYAYSFAFWMPLSVPVGWQVFSLDRRAGLHVELGSLLLVYAARYCTAALLSPPLFYLVIRWPVSANDKRRLAWYVLGYVPFSIAFASIRWSLLPPWIEETMSWGPRSVEILIQLTYHTFADVLLIFIGILTAAHAYSYFIRGQEQELERVRLQESLTRSELRALRAQLHPHFLFNTLQGISTLIDNNPPNAQKMLLNLADMLRTVLHHGGSDLILMRDEFQFVRAYLDLEHMRLGSRLKVRWQISPEAQMSLIPHLLLQPLVENAIVHGIAPSREGGWVSLEASVRLNRLFLEIRNSVAGERHSGAGVGLANVQARLQCLYAEDARLEFVVDSEASVAIARIEMPAFAGASGLPADRSAIQCES